VASAQSGDTEPVGVTKKLEIVSVSLLSCVSIPARIYESTLCALPHFIVSVKLS
jgi:chemotaxis receptor (MCP) glutamine deamidase CheD